MTNGTRFAHKAAATGVDRSPFRSRSSRTASGRSLSRRARARATVLTEHDAPLLLQQHLKLHGEEKLVLDDQDALRLQAGI